jgi:hypothetical protein
MTSEDEKAYIKQLEDHIECLEEGQFRKPSKCSFEDMGGCCCKCVFQRRIMGHPWIGATHGGKIFCYGCAAQETDSDPIGKTKIMLNSEHGMCEMFTPKEQIKSVSETYREELIKDDLDKALKGL